jgi:hypothetical protein
MMWKRESSTGRDRKGEPILGFLYNPVVWEGCGKLVEK